MNKMPLFHPVSLINIFRERLCFLGSETTLVMFYFFCRLFIVSNRYVLVLLAGFFTSYLILAKNITRTLWICFLVTTLFIQAKYFQHLFYPQVLMEGQYPVVISYFISFSDIFLLLLVYWLYKEKKSKSTQPRWELWILGFAILLSSLVAWHARIPNVAFFGTYLLIKNALIWIVSIILLQEFRSARITWEVLLVFISLNAVLIILQYFTSGPLGLPAEELNIWNRLGRYTDELPGVYRPGGISDDPNLLASIIGIFLPGLLAMLLKKNSLKIPQKLIGFCFTVSVFALIFTGSRAVWLVSFISLGVTCYFFRYELKAQWNSFAFKKNIGWLSLLFVSLIPYILLRISTLRVVFSEQGGGTFRLRHIQIAWDFMKETFWGVGLDNFQYLMVERYKPEFYVFASSQPHNILAHIGAELGFLGLGIFLLLAYMFIKRGSQQLERWNWDSSVYASFMGVLVFFSIAQFYTWFLYRPISEIFVILLGYLYVQKR